MADITEHVFTAKPRHRKETRTTMIFGRRVLLGTKVTVYEADGFTFPTKADAEAFAKAKWPRLLPSGRYLTADGYQFPPGRLGQAKARQANVEKGAR